MSALDADTYSVLYATRDRVSELVDGYCDVWCVKPIRLACPDVDNNVVWSLDGEGDQSVSGAGYLGMFELEWVREVFGTVPDDDRQCLVREGNPQIN